MRGRCKSGSGHVRQGRQGCEGEFARFGLVEALRYRGMAFEAVPAGKSAKEALTRGEKATAVVVENPTVGEP